MTDGNTKTQHSNKQQDPNKSKRPPTAFLEFMVDSRVSYKEKHPDSKGVSEALKACGPAWKEMTTEEKAPYIKKASEKRAMEAYKKIREEDGSSKSEASDDGERGAEVTEKKKMSRKKDPSKPERPLTPFMEFMIDFMKTYKQNHPDSKRVGDATKAGGIRWKEMTSDEKRPYVLRATEKKKFLCLNATVTNQEKNRDKEERNSGVENEGNGEEDESEMNAGEEDDEERQT